MLSGVSGLRFVINGVTLRRTPWVSLGVALPSQMLGFQQIGYCRVFLRVWIMEVLQMIILNAEGIARN